MAEKSGLDILHEILEKLNILDQKVNILDQNIKTIANSTKLSELLTKAVDSPLKEYANGQMQVKEELEKIKKQYSNKLQEQQSQVKIQAIDPTELLKNIATKKEEKDRGNKTYVRGKVMVKVDGKEVPVSLADITVFNDKDKVIKQTRANMGGDWMVMIGPGKYVVEIKGKYKEKILTPKNINFTVEEGQQEVIVE